MPNCPCGLLPMCPIPQGTPSLSSILTMIPLCPCVLLPICQKRCQVVKKMSNVKKVKHMDYGGGSRKKLSHIMRFTHTDVNFDVTYDGDQKPLKCAWKVFLNNFGDLHIWCQNWHQYVWTSLCEFIFFVNLLHSLCVWLFDIWHLFDILTSFLT